MLRWEEMDEGHLALCKNLLALRRKYVTVQRARSGAYEMLGERAFKVTWPLENAGSLVLVANCGDQPVSVEKAGRVRLWSNGKAGAPWTANWLLA